MIQVLRDDERLAVFRMGKYKGLKGPGIVVYLPILEATVRLRVGDTGNLITCETADFGGMSIPVTGDELSGSRIEIVDFDDSLSPPRPRVVPV
jgi:regulator of protease activity HflC (stomatin/prohibitin superfamily)